MIITFIAICEIHWVSGKSGTGKSGTCSKNSTGNTSTCNNGESRLKWYIFNIRVWGWRFEPI